MSIDTGRYMPLEFMTVTPYRVGGVALVVGRLTQEEHLGPSVYAAALNEYDLHHSRRGFGNTRSNAIAALLNRLGLARYRRVCLRAALFC
jgi:hypothetical protein